MGRSTILERGGRIPVKYLNVTDVHIALPKAHRKKRGLEC